MEKTYRHSKHWALELQVHEDDARILFHIQGAEELQEQVKVALVEQNRPDWALYLIMGAWLMAEELETKAPLRLDIDNARLLMLDRLERNPAPRPEYETYVGVGA